MPKPGHNIPAPPTPAEQSADISSDLAQMSLLIILGFIAFLPSHTPWTVFPFFVFAWMLCLPILRRRIANVFLRIIVIVATAGLFALIAWNVVPEPAIHASLGNMTVQPVYINGKIKAAKLAVNMQFKNSGDEASYRTVLSYDYVPIPFPAVDDKTIQRLKAKALKVAAVPVPIRLEGSLYPGDVDDGTINNLIVPLDWRFRHFLKGQYGVYVYGIVISTSTIHTRRVALCGVEVINSLPWNCSVEEKELP